MNKNGIINALSDESYDVFAFYGPGRGGTGFACNDEELKCKDNCLTCLSCSCPTINNDDLHASYIYSLPANELFDMELVFGGTCRSLQMYNLQQAFFDNGVKLYVGFEGYVGESCKICNGIAIPFTEGCIGTSTEHSDLKDFSDEFFLRTVEMSVGDAVDSAINPNIVELKFADNLFIQNDLLRCI